MPKEYIANVIFTIVLLAVAGWLLYVAIFKKKPDQKPLNRRQRRELEFANKSIEELLERRHKAQKDSFNRFFAMVQSLRRESTEHRDSMFKFANLLFAIAEKEMVAYERQCRKKNLPEVYMPPYFTAVMYLISREILDYGDKKDLQHIAFELMKFCENRFNVGNLRSVIYRHKGKVHYEDRCRSMAEAILKYFKEYGDFNVDDITLPFDFLTISNMYEWQEFKSAFYHSVVDQSYNKAMQAAEKINYNQKSNRDNQVHRDNQRQRAKRIAKRGRRKYA